MRPKKTKTITLTYPDNFEEWSLDVSDDGVVEVVCPTLGCLPIRVSRGLVITETQKKIEAHNREYHATESTPPVTR